MNYALALAPVGIAWIVSRWIAGLSERPRPSPLSDEALGDTDCRTNGLVNELCHFGTDTTRERNDHARR
jgi:hypothetical protein